MNSILDEFEPFDDKISGEIVEKKILIFIFLNCKLDENLEIYVLLLDAFNSMSTSKFTILISFNSQGSDAFEKLLKEKNLKLNINIIRLTNVERLEILKRSSLFITNGDIPSINESLYCGVPLLCLPVTSNQILYSNHISNELKLGVMIDFTNFNKQNFIESINNLIYNSIYRIECLKFSKLMKESQTIDNATKIIHNFIL
jgi:UDP:flavonoid glycosyltransferase YjiC (YdhE family)